MWQEFPMQSLTNDPVLREVAVSSPSGSRRSAAIGWLCVLLVVALFCGFIAMYFAPAITEPDDNGYFAQATRWVRGGTTWFKSASDAEYIGMHWLWDSKSGTYVSRYPPGLPAFIAILYQLGGYKLAMLANPLLAVGSLIGLYFASRRLLPVVWALTGVVLLATNPTFITHTLAGDSHMAVTFCLVWGTGLLLLWREQRAGWQIFLAGLVLGCIPAIRYPDSLVALGVGAFILCNLRLNRASFGHLGAAALGALIPILPLLVRNQLVLGGFWKTGYALTNEQTGFSFAYFKQHAVQYLQIIQGDGLGIVFALGLLGIVWMICVRGSRAIGVMFSLFVVPMLLLYMAYYWAPGFNAGATMRFLLPTFPIYILAGMWMLANATRTAPRAVWAALPVVMISFQLLWGTSTALQSANRMGFSKQALSILTEKVREVAQRDDVVVASAAFLQHADFVREWKLADMGLIRGGGPGGGGPGRMFGGDGNGPSPMQAEKQLRLRELYTGSTAEKLEKFAADVNTWARGTDMSDTGDGHSIYIVCAESELRTTFGRNNAEVTVVERIELPKRPFPPASQNIFGGGPPGMGGPGGGRQGGGPGGGGMFGMQNLDGATWVIAKWTPSTRSI
jgi:4-amino-4-deoxy-L-arabinose transferase-like glycosyltransferase